MDTGTVLSIIEMIDTRILAIQMENKEKGFTIRTKSEVELTELLNHLQEFIENEVSKAENQTGE